MESEKFDEQTKAEAKLWIRDGIIFFSVLFCAVLFVVEYVV